MKNYILVVVAFTLTACKPAAPSTSDTSGYERRIKELEAEVANLRQQLAKPAPLQPAPQDLSGLFTAADPVNGVPDRLDFTAPGICQMHFPNGLSLTGTYENKSGGFLIDTKGTGVFFARRAGAGLEIAHDGHAVSYAKQ